MRDGFEAVEVATLAGKLTASMEPTNIAAQTAAHAEVGAFDRAVECQRRALSSAALAKQYEVEAQQRMANYLRGKPCRDSQLMPAHLP